LIYKFEEQKLEINKLKVRVKHLEDIDGLVGERSGDDAPIKGRNLDEGEATAERVSDDTEEMETVLTSMDAVTVLASKVAEVPTGNGSIPTASPLAAEVPTGSDVVPTASLIFATATVIDAQVSRELEEQLVREDQRMSEQIARDAEVTRIHVEEELQSMIDGLHRSNETVAKGMTFEEIKAKFTSVWKQIEDFIPMGSKEKAKRLKRKGLNLEQEGAKKLKSLDEVPEEVKSPDEVPEEKVKEMMRLVPIKEVYVEALQVKHPIIDWKNFMHALIKWKLYDMCGVHQVTSKDKESFMLVEKDDPLRNGLALVMICYKLQVENYSQMLNDLILKIYKIAKSPRQQGD
nr:hypothetical protein [Tanacetum cinerariifolium]